MTRSLIETQPRMRTLDRPARGKISASSIDLSSTNWLARLTSALLQAESEGRLRTGVGKSRQLLTLLNRASKRNLEEAAHAAGPDGTPRTARDRVRLELLDRERHALDGLRDEFFPSARGPRTGCVISPWRVEETRRIFGATAVDPLLSTKTAGLHLATFGTFRRAAFREGEGFSAFARLFIMKDPELPPLAVDLELVKITRPKGGSRRQPGVGATLWVDIATQSLADSSTHFRLRCLPLCTDQPPVEVPIVTGLGKYRCGPAGLQHLIECCHGSISANLKGGPVRKEEQAARLICAQDPNTLFDRLPSAVPPVFEQYAHIHSKADLGILYSSGDLRALFIRAKAPGGLPLFGFLQGSSLAIPAGSPRQ